METAPEISVVVPLYNEEKTAEQLVALVKSTLEEIGGAWELVLVSDGSTDRTDALLQEASRLDTRVKLVVLSRNFGQQAALCAGMDYARGKAVITMDADLQHPPQVLKEMVRLWRGGYEVVFTVRKGAAGAGWLKRLTSNLFYRVLRRLSRIDVRAGAADFRLLDRAVVECLGGFHERHLFYRGLVNWVGFRQIPLEYTATPRFAGKSKYTYKKMLSLAEDALLSFSELPLKLAIVAGSLAMLLVLAYAVHITVLFALGEHVEPGWTSLMCVLLIFGSTILLSLGVIGLYIGRIYEEVKRRPRYIVRRDFGFERPPEVRD
jgi:polyisoprenyl-phosphate glycosyltransferase